MKNKLLTLRFCAFALAFNLSLAFALPQAAAQNDEWDFFALDSYGDTLYYKIGYGNTVSVVSGGASTEWNQQRIYGPVDIPATVSHDGTEYTVTAVGYRAFDFGAHITSVTLPNTINFIMPYAFSGCYSMTSINIPDNVYEIQDCAFNGCSGLESIIIPPSVNTIGDEVFVGCSSLTEFTLPNTVVWMGRRNFLNCSGLTAPVYNNQYFAYLPQHYTGSYTIPAGITTVCGYAFARCPGLSEIHFPASVTDIGPNAFEYDSALTHVELPPALTVVNNDLFFGCINLQSVVIPDLVETIEFTAFCNCFSLTSVQWPASLRFIGSSAFDHCLSLTEVHLPNHVETIDWGAFSACANLRTVTLGQSLTSLGSNAFQADTLLSSVTFPATTTSIGEAAFLNCMNLDSVVMKGSTPPSLYESTFLVEVVDTNYQWVSWNIDPHVTVPCGAEPAYRAAEVWSTLSTIEEDCSSGIDTPLEPAARIYCEGNRLHIDGNGDQPVSLYDLNGRLLASGNLQTFTLPAAGVYMVRIGDLPARRVVCLP